MPNAIWFISYKLKNDASVEDFLLASEKCHDEVLSKQRGFISWEVLRDGDTWVDLVKWENVEDAKNGETAGASNPISHKFYSFINMNSCKLQLYSVEKSHQRRKSMFKKILIVNATPKKDGLCYSFVEAAKEAADGLGLDSEIIRLAGLGLTKCAMCHDGWGLCFKEHRCAFGSRDGFDGAQLKAAEADAFVYITPVYWGDVSEELKIFWDKLRRCESTKQWNGKVSFHKDKPCIIVASAGGGGGGIVSTFAAMERTIDHLGENSGHQNGTSGVFDYIAVNRWNQVYKREALKAAVAEMTAINRDKKEAPAMNHLRDLEKF